MSTFNQGVPSVPTILNTSNCFIYSNSASGNALSVQQLGAGNVVQFSNAAGGSNVFVMTNTGRIGIGTATPAAPLTINSNFGSSANPALILADSGTQSISVVMNSGPGNYNQIVSSGDTLVATGISGGTRDTSSMAFVPWSTSALGMRIACSSNIIGLYSNATTFYSNASAAVMTLVNGRVGVGTVSPGYPFQLSASGTATSIIATFLQPNLTTGGASAVLGVGTVYSTATSGAIAFMNYGTNTTNVFQLSLAGYGGSAVHITSTGVGIGRTDPGCTLDVVGTTSVSTPSGYYFSSTVGTVTSFTTSAQAPSIRASAQVHGTAFFAYSDARIKNIEPSTASHLETLNALKVRAYTYIDKAHDPRKKFGFIAQEVEEIMPTTINKETRIIPNIFRIAESVSSNVITLVNHGLNVGTKVKLIKFDNSEIISNIVMTSDDTFQIESPLSETRIFLYGVEVTDFMSIDYTQIFSSAVGAIQELSAENTALEQSLATATANVSSLKTQLAAMDARLALLESKLAA